MTMIAEEALEESVELVERQTDGRRMSDVRRRMKARSRREIWNWLAFLIKKINGFMKYLKCDSTAVVCRWRPLPILARIESLDLGRVRIDLQGEEEGTAAKADGRTQQADSREEETAIILSPRKPRRRWIRCITKKMSRKNLHKRGLMEFDSEARARLTRKRRRVSRGWVKQQCEASDAGDHSHHLGAKVHNSSGTDPASDTTRPVDCYQIIVKYNTQSRGRQKSTPFDETVDRLLPDELVDKVLAWLPVTSVLRFRAVCRRWQTILSSQGWLPVSTNPPCPTYFSSSRGRRECSFYDECLRKWSKLNLDYLPYPACRLLAASGGLLCMCFSGVCRSLYICNPVTKSWRELPPFHHKRRHPGTMLVHLLVDRDTQSYKVIVIGHPTCLAPAGEPSTMTEVYDSQTNNWTALANVPCSGCILAPSIAFRNGTLYCLTECPTGLLAFNIARRVWRRLEIKSHSRVLCVLEHNGHILIVASLTARVTRLGIWRLRETFPRVWMKVALMPVEHALYFLLTGKFQCFAQGDSICFASPRRPRWLVFDIMKRTWTWGTPARGLDPDHYNKWFFYEPRLHISA